MSNTFIAGYKLHDNKLTFNASFLVMLLRSIDLFREQVICARYIFKFVQSRLLLLESLTGDNTG